MESQMRHEVIKQMQFYRHASLPYVVEWQGKVFMGSEPYDVVSDALEHELTGINQQIEKLSVWEEDDIAELERLVFERDLIEGQINH
jgi:hypothetical protein